MRVIRVLNSTRLPCGCLVGIYESYSGEVVAIVDVPESTCKDHRVGQRVEDGADPSDMAFALD